jgi:hypothetical protein
MHDSFDLFAIFRIGHSEHGDVGDVWVQRQAVLDFSRIDIELRRR